jgi:hypothetical protein
MGFTNPYLEERKKSPGEIEVEHGNFLLMLFRFLKVPMPHKADHAAVERTGQLLTRKWPWLARFTQKDA